MTQFYTRPGEVSQRCPVDLCWDKGNVTHVWSLTEDDVLALDDVVGERASAIRRERWAAMTPPRPGPVPDGWRTVPADHPVKVLGPDDDATDRVTCGSCGRSWDDAITTGWTPAPSGRCPFEYWHPSAE